MGQSFLVKCGRLTRFPSSMLLLYIIFTRVGSKPSDTAFIETCPFPISLTRSFFTLFWWFSFDSISGIEILSLFLVLFAPLRNVDCERLRDESSICLTIWKITEPFLAVILVRSGFRCSSPFFKSMGYCKLGSGGSFVWPFCGCFMIESWPQTGWWLRFYLCAVGHSFESTYASCRESVNEGI